jgi:hypothetical protein
MVNQTYAPSSASLFASCARTDVSFSFQCKINGRIAKYAVRENDEITVRPDGLGGYWVFINNACQAAGNLTAFDVNCLAGARILDGIHVL